VALFEFNADFIAAVAGGTSDEDTLEMFAESIRGGADELEKHLLRSAGEGIVGQTQFVKGAFEIPLDQDQFDIEFGGDGAPPQPRVRQAIIVSTIPGSREMSRIINGD
jgi:hypothetical protein